MKGIRPLKHEWNGVLAKWDKILKCQSLKKISKELKKFLPNFLFWPQFFSLWRYTNAGNGLDQVKSLLAKSIPEDLVNCDKFLTISFKYFASALRLFSEEVWLDTYIHYASILKENPLTFDEMAACILFMNPQAPCEEPEKIQKLGNQVLSQISSKQSVRSAMMSLKAMTQFYSHGSTSNFFGDSFIDNTEASFSSMPSFKASDVSWFLKLVYISLFSRLLIGWNLFIFQIAVVDWLKFVYIFDGTKSDWFTK